MRDIEVIRYQKRLDGLFSHVSLMRDNAELQSHWARYLCILLSGFLEVSVRSLYSGYAKTKAAPYVVNFVERNLERLQNPNMEKILSVAVAFSPEWEAELRAATEGELKDAVDSVVANRNRISHGQDVGITYVQIKEYYKSVNRVLDLVEQHCSQ
jgi:hypothetical protein